MNEIKVPKGLSNVIVDETSIATTDSVGHLLYRGYKVVDLANKLTFEDISYLVVYGKLPDKEERESFINYLKENSSLNEKITEIMKILKERDIMRNLRSVVSFYPFSSSKDDELLLEIAAKFPKIISDSYRIARGLPTLKEINGRYSENFYYLLTGKDDREKARFLERLMVMYMEHEFNASTFALRVTASTLADPISAVTTALATLKGPLHGGANAEILDYILKFKSEKEAIDYVDEALEKKIKIMGFGHRVYKSMDPRAQFVKEQLRAMSGDSDLFKIAEAIEKRMWEEKNIPANLDFYAAIYMYLLGIDQELYTPIFATSRVFGWAAHYLEQISDNKLIRPLSEYVGPQDLEI